MVGQSPGPVLVRQTSTHVWIATCIVRYILYYDSLTTSIIALENQITVMYMIL